MLQLGQYINIIIIIIIIRLHLQEELSVGVLGAEQHGAGSRRPRGHGQDQRLLCNDHLLLSCRDASDELAVVLVCGDGVTRPEANTVWKIKGSFKVSAI